MGLLGALFFAGIVFSGVDPLNFVIAVVLFPALGVLMIPGGVIGNLGNSVVELGRDRLRASVRVFGLGWWRSRRLDEVSRILAVRSFDLNGVYPVDSVPSSTASELVAVGPGEDSFCLAEGYVLRLTRPLAAELDRRLAAYRSPMQ